MISLCVNASFAQQLTAIRFEDVSNKCGIDFVHTDGGTGKRFVVESVVGGFATFDFDGDGYVDIYFVNGTNLSPSSPAVEMRSTETMGTLHSPM